MSELTEDLIRRKAEHHDGLLSDLEEISLHQCELVRIRVIGSLCRKLRILYLQNNVIPKIEGLSHMKDLEYLNLALNNVSKIEGLDECEFLNKLDLTVNFVDLDELRASCEHMAGLRSLRDLYMTGNPCTDWKGFRPYVLAKVPQLERLDGDDVTRSERIRAVQQLPQLEAELATLASARAESKAAEARAAEAERAAKAAARAAASGAAAASGDDDVEDDDEDGSSPWCPEERVKIAKEVAKQKAEDEKKHDHLRAPERDYAKEHRERLAEVRRREEEEARLGERVRARNEAKLEFTLDDEDGQGNVVLVLQLPRFLDSSLIDVDAHPGHVSIVARGKVFRMAWPDEVVVAEGKATRSSTTGALTLTMPKARKSRHAMRLAKEEAARAAEAAEQERLRRLEEAGRRRKLDVLEKLADAMLESAGAPAGLDWANIVDDSTRRRAGLASDADDAVLPSAEPAAAAASGAGGGSGEPASRVRGGKGERLAAAAGAGQGRKARGMGSAFGLGPGSVRRPKKERKTKVSGLIQELTGLDAELLAE
ncbi:hypothetical protein FNF28_06525 [Cafeteria roenbergensis]|uniref:Dynein axonemal assembly factor 11-like CS domain-containing protein n=1 Tax=Cafeteria roenbergensis TaxID=33653 RepID=A0A5A8CZZ3_CAFRO|nr:hypothetical protein FNF28_06525 [Cafeteria roenbergensis]